MGLDRPLHKPSTGVPGPVELDQRLPTQTLPARKARDRYIPPIDARVEGRQLERQRLACAGDRARVGAL